MPNPQDIERRLTELERKINERGDFQLKYPLNESDSKIIRDVVSDRILDIVWNDYYYYSTFFESIDGYGQTVGGTGSVSITENQIEVATGATSGSSAILQKYPTQQNVLRWDRESRFRSDLSLFDDDAQEVRLSIGDSSNGVQDSHYGFWVDDATLKGTSSLNTTVESVTLKTLAASTVYSLEARYFPGSRVDFYVDGLKLGSVTNQAALPSAETTKTFLPFFTFYIENQEAVGKKARCSWFEYIQRRI